MAIVQMNETLEALLQKEDAEIIPQLSAVNHFALVYFLHRVANAVSRYTRISSTERSNSPNGSPNSILSDDFFAD